LQDEQGEGGRWKAISIVRKKQKDRGKKRGKSPSRHGRKRPQGWGRIPLKGGRDQVEAKPAGDKGAVGESVGGGGRP